MNTFIFGAFLGAVITMGYNKVFPEFPKEGLPAIEIRVPKPEVIEDKTQKKKRWESTAWYSKIGKH